MKKFGSPELDRILSALDEIARAVLRACSARPTAASAFAARDAFLEENEEIYPRPARVRSN